MNVIIKNILVVILMLPLLVSASILDSLEQNVKTAQKEQQIYALLDLSEFFQTRDFQKAYRLAEKALKTAQKYQDSVGIARSLAYMGYALTDLGELPLAIDYYQQSIEIAGKIKDSTILATDYNDLGYIFQIQHLNDQAISYYLKGLKIFELLNDSANSAAVYNNVGMLYSDENRQTTAREYFFKSLKIKENLPKNKSSIATTLNNIGATYFDEGDFDKAKKYFEQSLQLRVNAQDLPGIAQSYLNLCGIYTRKKNYKKSIEYAQKAYNIYEEINNKYGILTTLNHFSVINRNTGNYKLAIQKLKNIEQLAKELNNYHKLSEAYLGLGKCYQLSGDYKNAATYLLKHIALNDSLQKLDISNKINQIGLKYEFDKQLKQKEIKHLQQQHQNEIELNRQKFINYITGISLILVLAIALLIFKAYQDKQKANQIILQQKQIVEEQRQELALALKNITDSVKYAQRIQQAILPSKKELQNLFKQIEIIYLPKDIVSGDFYWISNIKNTKIIALADCTGHGVPGAFMSLLGYNALNKIVNEEKITQPHLILEKLDYYITETLHHSIEHSNIRDGMDIAIAVFNHNLLTTAGAYNSIWILRKINNTYQLIKLPADRQAIGDNGTNISLKTFTPHQIQLQTNDTVILFTDGFADQFGGKNNKKITVKQLKKLLIENADLPPEKQKQKLLDFFNEWKGELEQIDDVSLIFIKV